MHAAQCCVVHAYKKGYNAIRTTPHNSPAAADTYSPVPAQFSLSPMRKKYPDITIQPDSMCIVGSGGGNTVSGLAAARAGNVHSLRPASPVIIELAFARVSGYRRSCKYQYHIFSV